MTPEWHRRESALRVLDRGIYRATRKWRTAPTDAVEAARNRRWSRLSNALHLLQGFPHWRATPQHGDVTGASISILRAMRARESV